MKDLRAQVVLASVPLEKEKDLGRNRCILRINKWLCGWHCRRCFDFCDTVHSQKMTDGIHLTKWVKTVFVSRLDNMVKRALN